MTVDLRGVVTVLLPGTGSDDDYLLRVFGGPLRRVGADPVAVRPRPGDLIGGYRAALAEAAESAPIAVGGISLGAAAAAQWALEHPDRTVAVLAALPPWTGEPAAAPGAISARHTAAELRRCGLTATIDAMRTTSPGWLAAELERSWRWQWPLLPDALDEAAAFAGPTAAEMAALAVPMGVAGAPDDPIHPMAVACEWVASAPRAALGSVRLSEFGPRPEMLGRTCLGALLAAGGGGAPF